MLSTPCTYIVRTELYPRAEFGTHLERERVRLQKTHVSQGKTYFISPGNPSSPGGQNAELIAPTSGEVKSVALPTSACSP